MSVMTKPKIKSAAEIEGEQMADDFAANCEANYEKATAEKRQAALTDAAFIAKLVAMTGLPPHEIAAMLVNAATIFGSDDGEKIALDFIKEAA
jgi:hypothetical protein